MQRRKRSERKIRPGDWAMIIHNLRDPGGPTEAIGVYEGMYDFTTGRRYKGSRAGEQGNPRFRLKDGTHVFGCECYWTTMAEAKQAYTSAGMIDKYHSLRREFRESLLGLIEELKFANPV